MHKVTFAVESAATLQALLASAAKLGLHRSSVRTEAGNPVIEVPRDTMQRRDVMLARLQQPTLDLGEGFTGHTNCKRGKDKHTRTYANGTRDKGISGEQALLEILGREPKAYFVDEIKVGFAARGFDRHSYSQYSTKLVREKKVRRLAKGWYCLPGITVHPPVK
jgi:hypothetical protein